MPTAWRDRPWVVARTAPTSADLQPGPDPQHLDPDPNPVPGQIDWRQDTLVPTLPAELMGDQWLQLPVPGGPLDLEPESHDYGPGAGPGLTEMQSREVMAPWHGADRGAPAARRWQRAPTRDGAYHVNVVADEASEASPSTVALRETAGVGVAHDPHARRGYRIQRWRERFIDMHRYGVQKRPVYIRNAYTPPVQPGQVTQYTSPFPTLGWSGQGGIGSPDQWRVAQERRTPRPWDEAMTTDGTLTGGLDQGLGRWGL